MKRHTITELSDCWIVDGVTEIKKRPKPTRAKFWLEDFLFDLQKHQEKNAELLRKTEEISEHEDSSDRH